VALTIGTVILVAYGLEMEIGKILFNSGKPAVLSM